MALAGGCFDTGVDEDLDEGAVSDDSWAVTTSVVQRTSFTAKLFQSGGYDRPVVLLEGFDPADDYKPDNYWNDYYSPLTGGMVQPLLRTFPDTAVAEGWDVWVVSYKPPHSLDYAWTLGNAYKNQLHDTIRGWGGGSHAYVLAGFSEGGVIARKALAALGATRRQNEILAYVSFDAPHEGAYIPYSAAVYMLDHALCKDEPLGNDWLDCHERYVTRGLASNAAYSLLKNRVYPTCGPAVGSFTWPSMWSDCKDAGGCTLLGDEQWHHCDDYDGGYWHGDFATQTRSPGWFDSRYGAWFTDIPRYAISNSQHGVGTGATWSSDYEYLQADVSGANDHHLYTEKNVQPQKRGSADPFMDRLQSIQIDGPLWVNATLVKRGNWNFVSYDSAFGVHQGLSWTGRLTGQAGSHPRHSDVSVNTVRYLTVVLRETFAGGTFPGSHGPASITGPTVSVSFLGGGHGTVVSDPPGLTCYASWCTGHFYSGTQVKLSASPSGSSTFGGWFGACSGTGACTLTVTSDTSLGARWNACGNGVCESSESCETSGGSGECQADCGCCSGWQGSCFAPGTPVAMADGSQKPIEDVVAGDRVVAYDEQTERTSAAVVRRTYVHSDTGRPLVRVNGDLLATENHPFYVNGQWRRADEIAVGDQLLVLPRPGASGVETAELARVEVGSVELLPPISAVYNLEVDTHHDYFAGGVLVHNKTSTGGCEWNGGGGRPPAIE